MTLAASNAPTKAFWFLNRAAAGVVAAALTGACVGVVVFCYVQATSKGSGPGADYLGGLTYTIYFFALYGTVLGAAPGVIIMCFSRAKMAPWRSLVFLLPGTTAGIVILSLPWGLLPGTNTTSIIMGLMWVAGFTIGGFITARFMKYARR